MCFLDSCFAVAGLYGLLVVPHVRLGSRVGSQYACMRSYIRHLWSVSSAFCTALCFLVCFPLVVRRILGSSTVGLGLLPICVEEGDGCGGSLRPVGVGVNGIGGGGTWGALCCAGCPLAVG